MLGNYSEIVRNSLEEGETIRTAEFVLRSDCGFMKTTHQISNKGPVSALSTHLVKI